MTVADSQGTDLDTGFMEDLAKNGHGDDERGKRTRDAYLQRGTEILRLLGVLTHLGE